ncbi:MAG: hypothetical protein ACJ70T_03910 [Nitrososphaera sp.]
MEVAIIGCSASDILASCHVTISSLTRSGHKVNAIITESDSLISPQSSSPSDNASNQKLLTEAGIVRTFFIDTFDYSAITQANADAVNTYIKEVKPSLVIMPWWKSSDNMRRILSRVSLIACRGIGTILMYELGTENRDFVPTVIFEGSPKGSNRIETETVEEKFESHRTLLLEEHGLF